MSESKRPWLKHYDKEVPPSLDYDLRPLHEYLEIAARKWPKRKAIVFKNWSITFSKLNELTKVVSANLRNHGLNPGDRVAVMLPNLPQTIITYWSILRAGGVVVMTNPLYMETEIVHQFNDAGARFLITLDLLWPKISKLRDQIPIEKIFVTSVGDGLKFPLKQLYKVKMKKDKALPQVDYDDHVMPWTDLAKGKDKYTFKGTNPQDMALLQYTGGTTGIAKGCMITHVNMACDIQQARAVLHSVQEEGEKFISIMPFFHIYGLMVALHLPTLVGATAYPFPKYVPKDMLKAINKIKPTIFPGAPSIYISLIQQKDVSKYDLKSIRYCVSGSAAMPKEYIEQFYSETGAVVIEGYGLTEASPVTHINPLDGQHKFGSIGLPFPDVDAKIVDMMVAGGETLPPGKMGELVVRGPQVMKGYYNRPEDTADVLRNGWLFTGDIAYMDEDGYFFIVDRRKDLIISSGYNIYPREIDEVLHAHPKILEAVAVGIPHETRGEIVKVFIILQPGEELSRAEVIAYCRDKLAGYKVPRKVEFRDELPKTMVGKVLRRALREEEEEKMSAQADAKAAKKAARKAARELDEAEGKGSD